MSTVVTKLSEEEIREEIAAIKRVGKRIRKSPESAKAFLVKHGFMTKSGKPTKRFGG